MAFEYSNRKASYLGQTLTSGGEIETVDKATGNVRLTLHIKDVEGDVTSPGARWSDFRFETRLARGLPSGVPLPPSVPSNRQRV